MKSTPTSPTSNADGLLATDAALTQIGEVLDSINHTARARLDAETRVGLVESVAKVGRRLDALKIMLVGEAEQHQAAQTARGVSLRSVLATTGQITPAEATWWGHAAKSLAGHNQVQAAALAGTVSIQQARAIDTVLTELPPSLNDTQRAKAEQVLLDKAEHLNAKTLTTQGRVVLEEVAPEIDAITDELERLDTQRRKAHAARAFSMIPDGHGSILLRGQLPVLEATPLQKLVAAYVESDRRAHTQDADRLDPLAVSRSPEQRRADALIAITNTHTTGLQATGHLSKPIARNMAEPATKHLTDTTGQNQTQHNTGDRTQANTKNLTQSSTEHLTEAPAGNTAKPPVGNRLNPAADNQAEPATKNLTQSTAGQLPQPATGNLTEAPAQYRTQQNTGDRAQSTAGNLPQQNGRHLTKSTASPLVDSTAGNQAEATAEPLPTPDPHAIPERVSLDRQHNTSASSQVGRVPLIAGDRPRISVMMGYQQLKDQAEQAGLLTDGTKITAGELRRLLCDAELVPVVLGNNSEVLDIGRTQRLVTPTIRRALSLRDGGCTFPGCNTPDAGCEAHHINPWWNGGTTSLNNLVLLCPHHHAIIEPPRFFTPHSTPKWQVRITADGHPEFQPPTRNGTQPKPKRHHRTQQRALSPTRTTPPATGKEHRVRRVNERHQKQNE